MHDDSDQAQGRLDRREMLQWMAAMSAALSVRGVAGASTAVLAPLRAGGYGSDPMVNKAYAPGAFWPLTMTDAQRRCATALCDLMLPADARSPAASEVGVPRFLDEWVSSPYPGQSDDRALVQFGTAWLDGEAVRRFAAADFAALDQAQQRALCDPICYLPDAPAELQRQAEFFARFRDLAVSAFFSTRAGMKDIGYVGNVPRQSFDGPPPELIEKLGLK